MTEAEEIVALQKRYKDAIHAMQTGVAFMMEYNKGETEPKHLRVGINSAHVTNDALIHLLMQKGIITEKEFYTFLAEAAEAERDSYKTELELHYGRPIDIA